MTYLKRTLNWETRPDYNLQPQLAFYQQGSYTRVMVISIILPNKLWTVIQHLLLFALSSSPFFCLWSPLWFFYFPQKIFFQSNSALQNLKCDWFISFIQVGSNRTHPIFQIFVHQICMNLLFYAYTSYKFKRI